MSMANPPSPDIEIIDGRMTDLRSNRLRERLAMEPCVKEPSNLRCHSYGDSARPRWLAYRRRR